MDQQVSRHLPAISGVVREDHRPGITDFYDSTPPTASLPLLNQARTTSSASSAPSTLSSNSLFSMASDNSHVLPATPRTPPLMDDSPSQLSTKTFGVKDNSQVILPTHFDSNSLRSVSGGLVPDLALNVTAGGNLNASLNAVPITPAELTAHNTLQETKKQKRPRRKFDEIERIYKCNYANCTKAYGTLNHLNVHVSTMQHGPRRSPDEFKEERRQWKLRKKQKDEYDRAALIQQQQQFNDLWHMGHPFSGPMQSTVSVQHVLPSPPAHGRGISGYNSVPISSGYGQSFGLNATTNDLARYYIPSTSHNGPFSLSTNSSRAASSSSNLAPGASLLNQPAISVYQQPSYNTVPPFPLMVQGYSGTSGPTHTMTSTDTRELAVPQLRPPYTSIGTSWINKQPSSENPHPVQPHREQPLSHLHPQYFGGK